MELDYIVTTNVLNDAIKNTYDEGRFLKWAAKFAQVELESEKITKKFLDELSQDSGIIEMRFSENHRILYVDYEDEDEALEYAAECRAENYADRDDPDAINAECRWEVSR